MAKMAVVFGLSAVLTVAMPAVLGLAAQTAEGMRVVPSFAAVVFCLAAVAVYVSWVCRSGLQALLFTGPTAVALFAPIPVVADLISWMARHSGRGWAPQSDRLFVSVTVIVIVSSLLRFANTNHRSSDWTASRIWRQLLWISGAIALVVVSFAIL